MAAPINLRTEHEQLDAAMSKLLGCATDLTPLMREEAGIMAAAVEDNFAAQGRPKWKELQPATIRDRKKKGRWPGMILQRSGALAASIQSDADAHGAVVGTNKKYAAIHNFGGDIQKKESWGIAYLRTDRKGKLLQQKDSYGSVFARRSHKNVRKVGYAVAAHKIHIDKREFMKLESNDIQKMTDAVEKFITIGGSV
jgi:phage virion morphogenesis protein